MSTIEPIKVPKWGLSMEEGTVVEWHVGEGDQVSEGDDLVDIETTKITNVCEAHVDGLVRRIVAAPGMTLPVGALIAVLADESVSDAEVDAFVAQYESSFDPSEVAEADAGLEINQIDIGDGRALRVGSAGLGTDGKPILLLHGFGGDLENWSLVQEVLSANHPVHAIELPGHGQSTKNVGDGTLDDLAAAIVAAIGSLNPGPAILVGHSLGGAIATEVAVRMNDQITGLGLVCPAAMPGGVLSNEYLDGFVSAKRARDLRKPVQMLFQDPSMASRDMLDSLAKMKRLDGAQEALTKIKDGLAGGDPAYAKIGEKMGSFAGKITVIASKSDQVVGAPNPAQLPSNVTLSFIGGAGHMPHIEKVAEVVELLQPQLD